MLHSSLLLLELEGNSLSIYCLFPIISHANFYNLLKECVLKPYCVYSKQFKKSGILFSLISNDTVNLD